MTAPSPVVQPTAPVEERRAAAIAQAETERAEAAPPAPSPRAATRRAAATPVATTRNIPSAAEATPAATPVTTPPAAPARAATETPAAEPTPAAAPVEAGRSDNADQALTWGLAGGALLLVGLAGALAFRRRRAAREIDVPEEGVTLHTPEGIVTVPDSAVMPELRAPAVAAPAPVHAAPASPLAAADHQHGSLEAMVAAPPSAANPFLTRRNRMRRAQFLMARQARGAMEAPSPVGEASSAPSAHLDRSQTVYSFGPSKGRRAGLFPRTQ